MGPHHPGRERVALKIVLVGEVIQELRYSDAVHQPGCKPVGLVLPEPGRGLVQEVGDVARDPEQDCRDGKYETGDWNPIDGGIGEADAEIHRQVQIVQEHVNARVPVSEMTDFMGGDTGQALDARLCVAILVQNALGETHPVMCVGKGIDFADILNPPNDLWQFDARFLSSGQKNLFDLCDAVFSRCDNLRAESRMSKPLAAKDGT